MRAFKLCVLLGKEIPNPDGVNAIASGPTSIEAIGRGLMSRYQRR